jgi:hypothetical protein
MSDDEGVSHFFIFLPFLHGRTINQLFRLLSHYDRSKLTTQATVGDYDVSYFDTD